MKKDGWEIERKERGIGGRDWMKEGGIGGRDWREEEGGRDCQEEGGIGVLICSALA